MRNKDLQQGNASLFIPNIQITDEGDYRCFVIFTPDSGSATSTLQVSVKPQTALSHDQHIEVGITGSVRCEVSNFYPEAVKIRWVKSSKSNSRNSPLGQGRLFHSTLGNSDGTFNVTSVLIVRCLLMLNPEMYYSVLSATDPWRRKLLSALPCQDGIQR
ncbi:unnamed protein product [Staurois parvus]|uniref:Ig-like domain-containing protein n=1 Tax=Staurois parvus TaxID=386267 RepID=A0ABN9B780_9NEOB|nr:unnamed protein product [Staurois parvus]